MSTEMEEISVNGFTYGTFRVGTTVDVITTSFGDFVHPWNKVTYGRLSSGIDGVVVHYQDTAGNKWMAEYDGGWTKTLMTPMNGVTDYQSFTGPKQPWNMLRGYPNASVLKSVGELLYFKVINPFLPFGQQEVWLNIGYVTQLTLMQSAAIPNTSYMPYISWPQSPYLRLVVDPNNPTASYYVDDGQVVSQFVVVDVTRTTSSSGSSARLGYEQLMAVTVFSKDTWHPPLFNSDGTPKLQTNPNTGLQQFDGFFTREYRVVRKGQGEDAQVDGEPIGPPPNSVFPSGVNELTFCSGPGIVPGSEGIWLVDSAPGYIDPYNEGGLRVWKSPWHDIGPYAPYLANTDTPMTVETYATSRGDFRYESGYYDLYNIGLGYPYNVITWAMGEGWNVVHGIDTSGSLFSKWYSYNNLNYRTVVQGWPAGSVQWVWSCPRHARMVLMSMYIGNAKHLVAITTPPPPASYQEPFTPPGDPIPEIPADPPWVSDPPVAAPDSKQVTRW